MKKAILIASFGTTSESALNNCILPLEKDVAAAFPDWTVIRCFTSLMVIKQLAQQNIFVDSLAGTLEKLARETYQRVTILPTLLTGGGEYEKVLFHCQPYRSALNHLAIAKPLLTDEEDIHTVAAFIHSTFSLKEDESLLLMGHGTAGSDNKSLCALADTLHRVDNCIFLAALNGEPDFSRILQEILKTNCRRVILAPLMLTAGTHAVQHLSGPEEGSWLNRCKAAGLDVQCRLIGLGEAPEIRRLYLQHLSDCFTEK